MNAAPPVRLLAAALLFLSGCSRPPPPAPAAPRPELALTGVTLRVYRNSDPQLFAHASSLELMRSTNDLVAQTVHFDFLLDGLALDAPVLAGNLTSQAFDVSGGVKIFAIDGGLEGHTASAHFDGRDGQRGVASGTAPVEFHGLADARPWELTAAGFRFDVAEQHATFDAVRTKVGAP
jgi:hypothetical protein